MTRDAAHPTVSSADLGRALQQCADFASGGGWGAAPSLFALVPTTTLADHAAGVDLGDDLLTPVLQELDDPAKPLGELLPSVSWPAAVTGCALVTEITVAPPEGADPAPQRPARLIAGAVRGGPRLALLALKPLPGDDPSIERDLRMHPTLATGLLDALAATLAEA